MFSKWATGFVMLAIVSHRCAAKLAATTTAIEWAVDSSLP